MANRNNNHGGSGDFSSLSPNESGQKPIKGLDNSVLSRRGSTDPCKGANYGTRANIDFPSLVARGENPNGFTAATPNGTQTQSSDGDRNSNYRWADSTHGQRWGKNRDFEGDLSGN